MPYKNHGNRLITPQFVFLALIFLLAAGIRLALYYQFPILLTNDSWDYFLSAEEIFHKGDFFTSHLRDVRMPAYPTLLAITSPFTKMSSQRIVLLQKVMGLLNVLIGIVIGLRIRSWIVAVGMALFLGLNPVYLLFEHTLMPDTFFFTAMLSAVALMTICLSGDLNWLKAIMLGIVLGICVLVRSSVILLCVVMILGIIIARFYCTQNTPDHVRKLAGFLIMVTTTIILIVSPWLWRNYTLYGNISLVNFNNRNLLIYKAMHNPLDLTLPHMKAVNKSLSVENLEYLDYDWLWKLAGVYSTNEAEKIAGELVWEQVTYHPVRSLRETLNSFLSFGGFYSPAGNDRSAVRDWFEVLVSDVGLVHKTNTPDWAKSLDTNFVYIPTGSDTLLTRSWSKAGILYLSRVRPVLFVFFFVSVMTYLVFRNNVLINPLSCCKDSFIWICSSCYLINVLGHTISLTDNDRYASGFDLLPLLVILLVVKASFQVNSLRQQVNILRSR